MVARTGVKAHLSGGGAAYDPESRNLLTVFDMEKRAYRTIPAEGVIEVTAQKRQYKFQSRTG